MLNLNNLRSVRADAENPLMKVAEEIVNKPSLTLSIESVRQEIVQFFKDSNAEGVETTSFKLSLLDPISRTRIRIPVKAVECDHLQCFDLYNFLEFSSMETGSSRGEGEGGGKNAWLCPICQAEAKQEQLRVDGYFQSVLMKLGPEPQDVELFPDGSWKMVEPIEFKDVLLGAMEEDDDVIEITPRKKPKTSQNDNISGESSGNCSNNIFDNTTTESSTFSGADETLACLQQILGLSSLGPEKNKEAETRKSIVDAVLALKQRAERATVVDILHQILGLEGEENDANVLVEAVLNLKQLAEAAYDERNEGGNSSPPTEFGKEKPTSSRNSAQQNEVEKIVNFWDRENEQRKEPLLGNDSDIRFSRMADNLLSQIDGAKVGSLMPAKEKPAANKDQSAPKRPLTAYFHWLKENRARLAKPGMSIIDVSKAAGIEWNRLADKSKWERAAKEDKMMRILNCPKNGEFHWQKPKFKV